MQRRGCNAEGWRGHRLPENFRLHLFLGSASGFQFRGWPAASLPTIERLYPHLTQVMSTRFKTEKARNAAIAKAIQLECGTESK